MDADYVLYLGRETLQTALLVAAPVLVVAVVIGFLTAFLQAVTSIKDMTLGMVMKIACVGLTVLFAGGWMLETAVTFTSSVFSQLQSIGK